MISPQGYSLGEDPKAKNPFWDGEGEDSDVKRIFATATVDENVGTPSVQTTKSIDGHDITFGFNFHNLKGRDGRDGTDGTNGTNGTDGVSPTITVTDITGGHRVSITDATGNHSFNVMNGADGRDGTNGTNGTDGRDGTDGVSPSVSVSDITGGHRITVTDATGSETFDVMNGQNGVSPTIDVATVTGGHRVDITDAQGSESFTVLDGQNGTNGTNGQDGVSPTVSVTSITGGHQVSITDAQGTDTFNVLDGRDGTNGQDGVTPDITMSATADATSSANPTVTVTKGGTTANPTFSLAFSGLKGTAGSNGPGVPAGGTAGQVLQKVDGTDYNTEWATPSGGGGETLTEIYTTVSGETMQSLFTALHSLTSNGDTIVIGSNTLDPLQSQFTGDLYTASFAGTPAITFTTSTASSEQYASTAAYVLIPRRWYRYQGTMYYASQSFEGYQHSYRDGGWKNRYYFGIAPEYDRTKSGYPQSIKPIISVGASSASMMTAGSNIHSLSIPSGVKVYKVS